MNTVKDKSIKTNENNVPLWLEGIGHGLFLFIVVELLYPLIFGDKIDISRLVFAIGIYLMMGIITIFLIRLVKKKYYSKK